MTIPALRIAPALHVNSAEPQPGTVLLTPYGELDAYSIGVLRLVTDAALDGGTRRIVVDLGECSYLDGAAVGLFARLHGVLRQRGGGLVLVRPRQQARLVFNVLAMCGQMPDVAVVGTLGEALECEVSCPA